VTGLRAAPLAALGLTAAMLAATAALAGAPAEIPEVQYRPDGARVLVAGDSLEVGTAPHLRAALAGVPVTVDAVGGRPSPKGLEVLQRLLEPGHEVVVFDLGTNDDPRSPDALAGTLAAARELAGARCMVVATVTRPPVNGVGVDGLNAAIESFAASDPNVQLVDWHATTQAEPALLTDGIHATGDGYALRASQVADGVRACLAGQAAPPPRAPRPPRAPPPRPGVALPRLSNPLAAVGLLLNAVPRVLDSASSEARDALSPETPEPVLGGR
jgi:hypothetical protein